MQVAKEWGTAAEILEWMKASPASCVDAHVFSVFIAGLLKVGDLRTATKVGALPPPQYQSALVTLHGVAYLLSRP
jgi:hypothetical protein